MIEDFNDKYQAKQWLDEKIEQYLNVRYFPQQDKDLLNELIKKFGNTYFWYK